MEHGKGDEGIGRRLLRTVHGCIATGIQAIVSDKGDNEGANGLSDGAKNQCLAAADLLDDDESRNCADETDGAKDELDDEGVEACS